MNRPKNSLQTHFKMYKSGRLWVIAGLSLCSFALLTSPVKASDENTDNTTSLVDKTISQSNESSNYKSNDLNKITSVDTNKGTNNQDNTNRSAIINKSTSNVNFATVENSVDKEAIANDNTASNNSNTDIDNLENSQRNESTSVNTTDNNDANHIENTQVNKNQNIISISVNYIDDSNSKNIVGTQVFKGNKGTTSKVTLTVPDNWILDSAEQVNQVISFNFDQKINIKVSHKEAKNKLSNRDPRVYADPSVYQIIKKKYIVKSPDGDTQILYQPIIFERSSFKDKVTNKTEYGNWKATYTEGINLPNNQGYDCSVKNVPATYNPQISLSDAKTPVTVTYSKQSGNGEIVISYVYDNNGIGVETTLGTEELRGKVDKTITFTPNPPKGWELREKINEPMKLTLHKVTDNPLLIPDVMIYVVPELKTFSDEQLPVTRTIILHNPLTGTKKVEQKVMLSHLVTKNPITNAELSSRWTLGTFDQYTVPLIPGFTPDISTIDSETVAAPVGNKNVEVYYLPNTQQATLLFTTNGQNVVGIQLISGLLGDTKKVELNVPSGYTIVKGQSIPNSISLTGYQPSTLVVFVKASSKNNNSSSKPSSNSSTHSSTIDPTKPKDSGKTPSNNSQHKNSSHNSKPSSNSSTHSSTIDPSTKPKDSGKTPSNNSQHKSTVISLNSGVTLQTNSSSTISPNSAVAINPASNLDTKSSYNPNSSKKSITDLASIIPDYSESSTTSIQADKGNKKETNLTEEDSKLTTNSNKKAIYKVGSNVSFTTNSERELPQTGNRNDTKQSIAGLALITATSALLRLRKRKD